MEYVHPLERKPETTLFHYTSQSGLLGIVRSKSIWATNIHYLNDVTEFYHAIQLAEEEVRREKETASATEAAVLDVLNNTLTSFGTIPIYVCSFSENGDLLSQWRGYCPNGNGFSIGFEYSQLELPMERQHFSLRQCIYKEGLKRSIIKELVAKSLRDSCTLNVVHPTSFAVSDQVFSYEFIGVGACLKESSFSEEREWRMISWPKFPHFEPIHYREGKSMIIPYVEFKLAEEEENLKISKIIIGPTPHPELSRDSVISLLRSMNVECDDVQISGIPYRTW